MDQSSTPNLVEEPLPSQSDDLTSRNESQGEEFESCPIIPSSEDTTPCPAEMPVSLHSELSGNSNLSLENENCTIASVSQDSTSCPVEVPISIPNEFLDNNSITMESDDCGVILNSRDTTPSPEEVSLPNQDEEASGLVTSASPSHLRTALLAADGPTNICSQEFSSIPSKSEPKIKKGLKRKTPSANKSVETSIHLPNSNNTFRDQIAKQSSEEAPLPFLNQNSGVNCTEMEKKNCASTSSSQTTPQSPEEMDQSSTPNLVEEPLPSQSDDLTSRNESQGEEFESCPIIPSSEDTIPCSAEMPLSLHSELSGNSNLSLENENCTIASVSQDSTSCPVEVPISIPNEFFDINSITMESEDCAVRLNSHDTTPSPVVSLPSHDEVPVTAASPSLFRAALPATDDPTNTSSQGSSNSHSKSDKKIKKGVKRKTLSANKGIQTSIHLLDSNSTFRDHIVDLDTLRKETGVVHVEDLQNLDVSLDEWPMLLVSQLRLRDTIINNLNGVICELVECGQVLEQDLDYLKLKILELQQETKRRAKEDQQSHKNHGKETESQTTEEDFTEAWNRWYYGRWGDYYSESDPASSMYWPGHYMQPTTVASTDSRDEETQPRVVKQKQAQDTGKLHEEMKSEKDSVKKKKSKEKESSRAKSEMKGSEKRKKLKGKRKERHKREKSCKEHVGVEKEGKQPQDADDKNEKKKKEEDERRKRREQESNSSSQTADSPVSTQVSQEEIASTTSTTELIGNKEEEDKSHGWDTSQSITHQVATVAAQAVVESGYVFQEELGLYYDYNTSYYYNAENGLYYDTKSGTYFYYDHTTQSYQFHSQVSPTTTTNKRRKKKTSKKERTKSSSNNEDTENKEEGECTESDNEGKDDAKGESEEEEKEEGDATSPSHHEEAAGGGDIPPSLRLMVVEGGEKVRVGELHMVTMNGGTVGKEATNDVHLPDLNVSKMHAEIEYRSSGAEDHHYFLRDLGSKNGTFVNSVRLSETRQASKQMEVGHGWEVQFGTIKVKCHLHPGNLTCNECEPGLVLHSLPSGTLKSGEAITSFKNAKCKERARRKELKAMQKKYKLTHRDPHLSSIPAAGYTDRTFLRQAEKGSDNPYEKTEVASSEIPLKETNRGFALLQKMGWSEGQGLGKANSGITEPVQPASVVGQAGLGSSQSSALPISDPRVERRRKQLQITKERYKQSTGGHQP